MSEEDDILPDDPSDVEYQSGPFCRHYADPSDCTVLCTNCKHDCASHSFSDGECVECLCKQWKGDDTE